MASLSRIYKSEVKNQEMHLKDFTKRGVEGNRYIGTYATYTLIQYLYCQFHMYGKGLPLNSFSNCRQRSEKNCRVNIALNSYGISQSLATIGHIYCPIESYYVNVECCHPLKQSTISICIKHQRHPWTPLSHFRHKLLIETQETINA